MDRELIYQIALSQIQNVGANAAKNLLSYCGSAEKVFSTAPSKLMKIPTVRHNAVNDIRSKAALEKAEIEIQFIEKYNLEVLFFTDPRYPARLRNCIDAPILLYYKGNADLNVTKVISIVGTRRQTNYGKEFCTNLVKELSNHNILVVSGLAYGVDATAHKAALKHNLNTIGVLGHGMQLIYPAQHRDLAAKIVSHGGLLTEYSTQDLASKGNFPKRNRVIAGMSDATIVVETAIKGGSMITANIANSYNRDVFALPGKYSDPYSAGCNFLIKTHKAILMESATDLLKALGWEDNKVEVSKQRQILFELSKEEQLIVDILREKEEVAIDMMVRIVEMPPSKIASTILQLEMKGVIITLPGKKYKMV